MKITINSFFIGWSIITAIVIWLNITYLPVWWEPLPQTWIDDPHNWKTWDDLPDARMCALTVCIDLIASIVFIGILIVENFTFTINLPVFSFPKKKSDKTEEILNLTSDLIYAKTTEEADRILKQLKQLQ